MSTTTTAITGADGHHEGGHQDEGGANSNISLRTKMKWGGGGATGVTSTKSFRNVKHIDEASPDASQRRKNLSPSMGDENDNDHNHQHITRKNPFSGMRLIKRFTAEQRLHRAEVGALTRAKSSKGEDKDISRSWHSHYQNRSFRGIKYIDEKDECCWQNLSNGSLGVDHITDHYSDSELDRSSSGRCLQRSNNRQRQQQQHETMLEVMARLRDGEESNTKEKASGESKLPERKMPQKQKSDPQLRSNEKNKRKLNLSKEEQIIERQDNKQGMFAAMEALMGKQSVRLGNVAERPSLDPTKAMKSAKPLQPAIRLHPPAPELDK